MIQRFVAVDCGQGAPFAGWGEVHGVGDAGGALPAGAGNRLEALPVKTLRQAG